MAVDEYIFVYLCFLCVFFFIYFSALLGTCVYTVFVEWDEKAEQKLRTKIKVPFTKLKEVNLVFGFFLTTVLGWRISSDVFEEVLGDSSPQVLFGSPEEAGDAST